MITRSRVTIRDVAARAGVSRQTISRVINGSERVSAATEERVRAVIVELGYQPNAIARFMARGRTETLVCLAPNLADYTFASVIDGAEAAVRRCGYYLMSSSAPDSDTFASLIVELIGGGHAEGLLVINPFVDDRYVHLPADVPVVLIGVYAAGHATSSVSLDDPAAGRLAMEHLLALGHRRIATITGPLAEDCARERLAAYEQMMAAAGAQVAAGWVAEGNWSAAAGFTALNQIMGSAERPTAIFAQNDQMAVGVLRAARDRGIDVPQMLSVIGIDDIPLATHFEPPLTTVHQDFAEIGRIAARLLNQALADPLAPPEHVRLASRLVVRNSTAAFEAPPGMGVR
jgi:DNA-binding LacI/PurR family transcriptional regulator